MSYNASNIKNSVMRSVKYTPGENKIACVKVPDGVYASITFMKDYNIETNITITNMINLEVIGSNIIYLKASGGDENNSTFNLHTDSGYHIDKRYNVFIDYTYSKNGDIPEISDLDNASGSSASYYFNQFYFFNNINFMKNNISNINGITSDTVTTNYINIDASSNVNEDDKPDRTALKITGDAKIDGDVSTTNLNVTNEVNTEILNAEQVTINNLTLEPEIGEDGKTINPAITITNGEISLSGENSSIKVKKILNAGNITASGKITSTLIKTDGVDNTTDNISISASDDITAVGHIQSTKGSISAGGSINASGTNASNYSIFSNGEILAESNIKSGGKITSEEAIIAGSIESSGEIRSTNGGIFTNGVISVSGSSEDESGRAFGIKSDGKDGHIHSSARIYCENNIEAAGNITSYAGINAMKDIHASGNITSNGNISCGKIKALYATMRDIQLTGTAESNISNNLSVGTINANAIVTNILQTTGINTKSITTKKINLGNAWDLVLSEDNKTVTISIHSN